MAHGGKWKSHLETGGSSDSGKTRVGSPPADKTREWHGGTLKALGQQLRFSSGPSGSSTFTTKHNELHFAGETLLHTYSVLPLIILQVHHPPVHLKQLNLADFFSSSS
ncbi:hypothetical protein ACE6H2_012431 [Prunus campanulata]